MHGEVLQTLFWSPLLLKPQTIVTQKRKAESKEITGDKWTTVNIDKT